MSIRLLPMAGAVLVTAAPVLAQPTGQTPLDAGRNQGRQGVAAGHRAGMFIPTEHPSQVRAKKLLGMKVVNMAGEDIGSVGDVVFDKDGKVSALVIEAGGLMGIGSKTIGVAWRDVGSVLTSNVVRISLTKDEIDRAPPFKVSDEHSETLAPRRRWASFRSSLTHRAASFSAPTAGARPVVLEIESSFFTHEGRQRVCVSNSPSLSRQEIARCHDIHISRSVAHTPSFPS